MISHFDDASPLSPTSGRGLRGAGDALGLLPQIALVAGVGAVVAASPPLLLAVRLSGAAYLAWLGMQTIRHRQAEHPHTDESAMAGTEASGGSVRTTTRATVVLRQGFVTGVTNPKPTVFFIAVLPQFLDSADGPVPLQMLVLGRVFVVATLSVGTAITLIAGSARDRFVRSPRREPGRAGRSWSCSQ